MKEVEAKIPENFEELTKLSKNVKNYENKNSKNLRKCSKINTKIQNLLKEIRSRIVPDETQYITWTKEDVVKFVWNFELKDAGCCCNFRWISSLEDGKFAEKYDLIPDKHLKGPKFEKDSDVIDEGLEDIGITEKDDRQKLIRAMKKLVQNGLILVLFVGK